ncbi:Putative ribosomal protein L20 [Septoria linicola]|uniref:Ribosomal protein L20 n=1 Tax=Septoria linicola TaxID=215465 RepID=A0A9Q9EKF0_9PEZI|nr:putative ribosomal protein L20 [Septoria linicola]USW53207.1 Putative ribosomal protein L20 [Septoria linicola]
MSTSLLAQSLRPSLISSDTAQYVCKTCRRNAASYRRTRKMLRVKQDPSFAPSTTETSEHIIFNPPPSAPNVYHTPSKFLPQSDPRWKLHAEAAAAAATGTPEKSSSVLATIAAQRAASQPKAENLKPIRPMYEKKYHLTQDDIEEIRRLRQEDPRHWSRLRLAEKFQCSQFFVSLCVTAPEVAKEKEEELNAVKERWGRRKRDAREARVERKRLWGQDA